MEKYFKSGEKVFEIGYIEVYKDEDAIEANYKCKKKAEFDTTELEGVHKVTNIKILESKYLKKSLNITRAEAVRLYKFIQEIEAEKCKTTLTEYYEKR